MAKHLARIHGTEEDKVNCPFYFKIGACRHADRCSRLHHRPAFSPTILIKHIYRHPVREAELRAAAAASSSTTGEEEDDNESEEKKKVNKEQAMEDFLIFFENMYEELGKFGRLEALHVCDNLGDHMIGHVYAKFTDEEEAADALNVMNGRYYDGRKMEVEFSPVTDFREARCRDFDEDTCSRGGFCNFMHVKPVPMCLIRSLEDDCDEERCREVAEREHRERRRRKRSSGSGSGSGSGSSRRDRHDRKRDHRDRDGSSAGAGAGGGGSSRDRDRHRDTKRTRRDSASPPPSTTTTTATSPPTTTTSSTDRGDSRLDSTNVVPKNEPDENRELLQANNNGSKGKGGRSSRSYSRSHSPDSRSPTPPRSDNNGGNDHRKRDDDHDGKVKKEET